ncbi:MAG: metallophosphoesterase family protein [Sporichthyaceae bacterium]
MRYFTSDTHYGHANIIGFCGRPYSDVHRMNVDLVHRTASLLSVEDELWHLGDVALGRLDDTLTHLAGIAVEVTLVAGNHDRCHPSNGSRSQRFVETYRDRCQLSELFLTNTRLTLGNGVEVQVSHFPYPEANPQPKVGRNGKLLTDKFAAWRPTDDGSWLLCGHVHESWRQRGRMINVGVDAWAGQPVNEELIRELIDAGPRDLAPLPWR